MKDILIISYNEGAKRFDDSNCDEIIQQILLEEPAFIYVATQESISGGVEDHYQHHLRYLLEDLNYQLLEKYDASISIPTIGGIIVNKNVRSRIYFNKDKVCYNIRCTNERESLLPKIKITSKKFKESTKSGFKSLGLLKKFFKVKDAPEPTLFKGSIYTELILDINNNNEPVKFIFVNSHLFYKKKSNTGLQERIKEFNNLVNEFGLIEKWKDGYNIFFCGDLNFRLFSSNNLHYNSNTREDIYEKSINIIKKYITKLHSDNNGKKEINNNLKKESELYKFLNSEADSFYSELKKSIDNIGIHLTAKYKENTLKYTKELFNTDVKKVKNKEIENVFDILPKNKYIRIPSQTDVILYALSNNISIDPNNFKMYLSPDKSDHKMVSLYVNLIDTSETDTSETDTSNNNKELKELKELKEAFKNIVKLFNELGNNRRYTQNNKEELDKYFTIIQSISNRYLRNKIIQNIYKKSVNMKEIIEKKNIHNSRQKFSEMYENKQKSTSMNSI